MKNTKITFSLPLTALAAVAALILITAVGCDLFGGITPEERVEAFMSDINKSNRSGMRNEHVHPSAGNYDQIGSGSTFWDIEFDLDNDGDYSLSNRNVDGNTVTATITSQTQFSAGVPIRFEMREDDGDAKIRTLKLGDDTIIN